MNIFQNRDRFFGKPNFICIRGFIKAFWEEANKIKSELGDKGYYLDRYLSVIFETIADLDLGTASVVADNICSDISRDCCIVCCGGDDLLRGKEKSKFFEIVKKYKDKHPVDFNENHTKVECYTGKILIQNLELLCEGLKKHYITRVFKDIDYPIASEYFEKISSIIGEAKMEQFNDILVEAFISSPIGLSAVEHFISYALGTFLYREPERSKMLYQLMIDEVGNSL